MSTKGELDRESMFRKIMPSAGIPVPPEQSAVEYASAAGVSPEELHSYEQNHGHSTPSGFAVHQQTDLPPSPEVSVSPPAREPGSPHPAQELNLADLKFIDDIQPLNLVEALVDKYYDRYLQRLDGCGCQRCRDDVYGIVLNRVPPDYIPAAEATLHDLHNRELVTETVTQIVKAIFRVKQNPHHDALGTIRK